MISCTEFIPAYSQLFTYLEDHYGREEIDRFWGHLFQPDSHPLTDYLRKEGIRGCYTYWTASLSEEASDVTVYLNEKAGWFMIDMHRCPSKGRLLDMQAATGVPPYRDYCLHCDHYRTAVESVGLNYVYNFAGVDHAACSILITDPKVFDGRVIVDDNTQILDIRAGDNEYFHRDFHYGLNSGIDYIAEKHGEDSLVGYLETYTKNVLASVIADTKTNGLVAIEEKILDTYEKEKAPDAVKTELSGDTLTVTVAYCPAIKHLKFLGRVPSKWFSYTTKAVMGTIANETGYKFGMLSYDETTGAAKYTFTKR